MCFTFKDLQGRSGQITPINNVPPRGLTSQQKGLFSLKSEIDICGNVADLICYTKNQVITSYGRSTDIIYEFRWNQ